MLTSMGFNEAYELIFDVVVIFWIFCAHYLSDNKEIDKVFNLVNNFVSVLKEINKML